MDIGLIIIGVVLGVGFLSFFAALFWMCATANPREMNKVSSPDTSSTSLFHL